MTVKLDGSNLSIENVVKIAREGENVEISQEAWERINKCRSLLESKIVSGEKIYGVNTGIGELSEVSLPPEQIREFQKYLVYSHAAGYGEPMAEEVVRSAILSRINVHCHGNSGMRAEVTQMMVELLNKGVTPVMYQRGSVSACGDLSPMSQMALVLIGEGEAFYKGERLPGKEALKRAGITPIIFEARDGLASINGSNVITGWAALMIYEAIKWLKMQDIATAMTLEALLANMKAYDPRLHSLRGYKGAIDCAENVRRISEGSELLTTGRKKVQDSYSMRSTPQVAGAARDTVDFARQMVEIELNGVGDNPIFIPDDDLILTGANFQGTPIAFALEFLGTALTTVSALSERRLNRLVNPNLSVGLPAFLTKGAGMFSGMMLSQYTAGQMVNENRVLCNPAATGSIPAAADQEDFVSMGMTAAIKMRQILDNCYAILAIELMAAAQAFEFREAKPSPGSKAAYEVIRKYSPPLEEDRPLCYDHNTLTTVVRKFEILEAVENVVGDLK